MHIEKTRKFTVQPRQYESVQFGATVSASHHDLGLTDEDLQGRLADENAEVHNDLQRLVDERLDSLIEEDMREARRIHGADEWGGEPAPKKRRRNA